MATSQDWYENHKELAKENAMKNKTLRQMFDIPPDIIDLPLSILVNPNVPESSPAFLTIKIECRDFGGLEALKEHIKKTLMSPPDA